MTHLQSYRTSRTEEIARTSVFLWEALTWGTGLNHYNGNFGTNMLLRLWLKDRHLAYRHSWSGEYSVNKWSNSLRATAKCSKNAGCVCTMSGSQLPPTSTCDIAAPAVLPVSFAHMRKWATAKPQLRSWTRNNFAGMAEAVKTTPEVSLIVFSVL